MRLQLSNKPFWHKVSELLNSDAYCLIGNQYLVKIRYSFYLFSLSIRLDLSNGLAPYYLFPSNLLWQVAFNFSDASIFRGLFNKLFFGRLLGENINNKKHNIKWKENEERTTNHFLLERGKLGH